jgi:hypothetical protein
MYHRFVLLFIMQCDVLGYNRLRSSLRIGTKKHSVIFKSYDNNDGAGQWQRGRRRSDFDKKLMGDREAMLVACAVYGLVRSWNVWSLGTILGAPLVAGSVRMGE